MVEANANAFILEDSKSQTHTPKPSVKTDNSQKSFSSDTYSKSKSSSKTKKPTGSFADLWAQTAEELCLKVSQEPHQNQQVEKSSALTRCTALSSHIRSSFSKMSSSLANVFKGNTNVAITSQKEPFRGAGIKLLKGFV